MENKLEEPLVYALQDLKKYDKMSIFKIKHQFGVLVK